MAPSCNLDPKERLHRIAIGATITTVGFLLHRDPFAAVAVVAAGSTATAGAALGY